MDNDTSGRTAVVVGEPQHLGGESSAFVGFDFEAFEIISDVAKHLGRANEFFTSREKWYRDRYTAVGIPLLHNNAQAKEDANAIEHAMIILDAFRPTKLAAQQVVSWVTEQMEACRDHIQVLKARSGFLTFPDEILSDILEFAAYQQDVNEQKAIFGIVNAAVKLSHVCSRFRRLVVSSIGLWNRVCPLMQRAAISTCLERCEHSGADIFLSTSFGVDQGLVPFLQATLTSCQTDLWRRFVHTCDDLSYGFIQQTLNLDRLRSTTLYSNFPLLSDLTIHFPNTALDTTTQDGIQQSIQSKIHFYSTWYAPGLRSFTAENLIPQTFSGTNSLVSFSIFLNYRVHWRREEGGLPIAQLSSFLSSCPVLETFALKLSMCTLCVASEEREELPSVEHVSFSFSHCRSAVVKAFFSAIRFPNAERMRLVCDSRGRPANSSMQCQKILQEVFPTPIAFPSLRRLHLKISAGGPNNIASQVADPNYHRPILIPFSNLQSLRELELTTSDSFVEHLEESITLPPLQSLSIVDCWKMDFDWFLEVCSRINAIRTGGESDFEASTGTYLAVTVRGCPWEHQWEEIRGPALEGTTGGAAVSIIERDGGEESVDVDSITDDQSVASS